ncbi:phosphotransferase [uncultured Psychroserpens sp.]|uniref:phosphotransferase n=1 Tax=uncultured Psychroserpens sp. TaxID=255436 RepID=UPI00263516F7|nr:phosphotransferase [uncultured Psychroserpens sp.]
MKIPIIPGRGLVTSTSTNMRLEFLNTQNIDTHLISDSKLELQDIRNNIESYIGSTEIPIGIVGPLLFNDAHKQELVYCPAGTLEGALIASMNRGAKVISKSNGFTAEVKWQKMTRSPMFIFNSKKEALIFKKFVETNFFRIKKTAESYSNHAELVNINSIQLNQVVHLKFEYHTGDASGQNMTTTCTWHAMLFIVEAFKKASGIVPIDFVIEGNGASDKKVSHYNIKSGRGIHVVAECTIPEKVINEVLRTTSDKLMDCFYPSKKLALKDGMVGYNINVANSIASIFVATGQDLASIHESGIGILHLEKKDEALNIKLTLPNLVIGSIGGGTSLPKQSQALEIMNCYGSGKVNRLAKLIAGFTLGLEISTYAAIVSGEFAKAHEKLGRNKPVKWLLKSEITTDFIRSSLGAFFEDKHIENIALSSDLIENGILTNIASKVNKKIIGFIPFEIKYKNDNESIIKKALIKSKPLDVEVIKGLHIMAASINPDLSDLLKMSKQNLEYKNCHLKEVELYEYLHHIDFQYCPKYYGKHINPKREIHMILQEYLEPSSIDIMNSENHPECWKQNHILEVITSISKFHQNVSTDHFKHVQEFKPWLSVELYKKMMMILITECTYDEHIVILNSLYDELDDLEEEFRSINLERTIIHNDFNPRNIAIRKDGTPIIYDWELAMIDFSHRDIVEFLSFVLPLDFKKETLFFYLNAHYKLYTTSTDWNEWLKAYRYSLKVYIITRLSFYEVSGLLAKYDFSKRVLNTALAILKCLKDDK